MKQEIDTLREILYKLLETEQPSSLKVLELSNIIDKLILDYYRSQTPLRVKN